MRANDNTLIGVVSFVHGDGCDDGKPTGFTKILAYHKWISKMTGMQLPSCSFFY